MVRQAQVPQLKKVYNSRGDYLSQMQMYTCHDPVQALKTTSTFFLVRDDHIIFKQGAAVHWPVFKIYAEI